MLGAWAEKCFLQRGLRSHWCFLFLWVKPGGLGWVSKVSADVRCPRGKRGLHVGHWGVNGRTVDVAGHWGRVGGGHLRLEGAGCRGVSGCDGRGGVGGVHRWGVAGVHWGREGGDRRGVGSDGRRVAGYWRGSWDGYVCNRALHCSGAFLRLLVLLPQVNLGVALALVAAGELAAADLAGEGLLARVRADVGRQVVAAAEVAHADPALEGLLAGVDANVARQLVWAREATVTGLNGACVGALVGRCLAWPVGVLAHATGLDELRLVDAL